MTVSHDHFDHNNVKKITGNPQIFNTDGAYELPVVEITGIKSYHDKVGGRRRGENVILSSVWMGLTFAILAI